MSRIKDEGEMGMGGTKELKIQSACHVFRELWWSDAVGHHVVEPSLDFHKILANQKDSKTLPLSTKHRTMGQKTS